MIPFQETCVQKLCKPLCCGFSH